MSTQAVKEFTQRASQRSLKRALEPVKSAPTVARNIVPQVPLRRAGNENFGREIYVYSHLQTRQVVYSLTKAINNNNALKQIPFNGKKTVPAALRKDHWAPMAKIEFEEGAHATGLLAYRMLREYKKMHELQWPLELAKDEEGRPISKRLLGFKLQDQRANSIADMAATLTEVTTATEEQRIKWENRGKKKRKGIRERIPPPFNGIKATVKWNDIFDAEFAESWPATVVHDKWEITKNNRKPFIIKENQSAEMVEVAS